MSDLREQAAQRLMAAGDLRIDVVLREINQGALSGLGSEISQYAAALVIAALDSVDEHLRDTEVQRLRAHILDIDAHATPYGDIPDDPGYTGVYLVTAGALHRALGTIGHSAPKCQAEAAIERVKALLPDMVTIADAAEAKGHLRPYAIEVMRGWITTLREALDQPGDQEGTR